MSGVFQSFEDLAGAFTGAALAAVVPEDIDGGIFGAELDAVAGAAPRRRLQFIAGRTSARWALHRLGRPTVELPRLESGAPRWPAGVVGSIAHCDGCALAIAAPVSAWSGFGIDVEPSAALPEDAAALALTATERDWLQGRDPRLGRALFCAKECVHKLVNPLTGAWLEFDEVMIELDPSTLAFLPRPRSAEAANALEGLRLLGRIAFSPGFLAAVLGSAAGR